MNRRNGFFDFSFTLAMGTKFKACIRPVFILIFIFNVLCAVRPQMTASASFRFNAGITQKTGIQAGARYLHPSSRGVRIFMSRMVLQLLRH